MIWNVRGLNGPAMHLEVKHKIQNSQLSLVGLLETRVKKSSLHSIRNCVILNGWLDESSISCSTYARI